MQEAVGRERAGAVIEAAMARIALALVERGVRRLVVAGGETSGAVVAALGVRALRIGPPIDPGVPWTVSLDEPHLALALKSGNFGAPDFFRKAFDCAPGGRYERKPPARGHRGLRRDADGPRARPWQHRQHQRPPGRRLADHADQLAPRPARSGAHREARSGGRHVAGDKPSKEAFLHQCVYDMRPGAGAIVHLHSTHSVAVSCLAGIDADDVLPPLTAYYVMRVGRLPLIPYFPPGDERLAGAVRQVAARHAAVLLANHGPVVAGRSLDAAVGAVEELEATARLYLLLHDRPTRPLDADQVDELRRLYPAD